MIRLTESDLHRVIKESVKEVLRESWEEDYNAAMDKQDYQKNKAAYDSKKWYQKILAMMKGQKPKDPNADTTLRDLLSKYVEAFNAEHGLGKRIEYPNGETFHSVMKYSSDDTNYGQPVLSATHYADGYATQSRKGFRNDGQEEEWGIQYPYNEFGATGDVAPDNAHPGVKKQYDRFKNNRAEIQNVINNRQRNKK